MASIIVNYVGPKTKEWCPSNKDVEGSRKECNTDQQCVENVRDLCDKDPGCYGISWNEKKTYQDLKLCRSKDMVAKQDGWRTWIKQEGNRCKSF